MNIYNEIKNLNDEELKEYVDKLVEELVEENGDIGDYNFIGADISYNPKESYLDDLDFVCESEYRFINGWSGLIPKGIKVNYGVALDLFSMTFINNGLYYYYDDDSYIYEFFKYIRACDVDDEFDIIENIFRFIRANYFATLKLNDREKIHSMISKNERKYFDRIKEHSITDFYKDKCFMCSEVSLFVQNLLSTFDIESYYVMDKTHCYNICAIENKDGDKDYYVLDCSMFVDVYDIDNNKVSELPYMELIENANEDMLEQIFDGEKELELDNYYILCLNGRFFRCCYTDEKRKYATAGKIIKDNDTKGIINSEKDEKKLEKKLILK